MALEGQTWMWAIAPCSCNCMETYAGWWRSGEKLRPSLGGEATTHLGGMGSGTLLCRRQSEKWQKQQVMAARLSSKLPARVLGTIQAAIC